MGNQIRFPLNANYPPSQVTEILNDMHTARQVGSQACSVLIAAFPCTGKTTLGEMSPVWSTDGKTDGEHKRHVVLDLDSSHYKFPDDRTDFPRYLDDIEVAARLVENAIVLVSCHEATREGMALRGLDYVRVCPDPSLKDEWVARSAARDREVLGREGPITALLAGSWEQMTEWIAEKEEDKSHRFLLNSGQFLSDTWCEICYWYDR